MNTLTTLEVAEIITKSQEEIVQLVKDGVVPKSVPSFGDLHDYVDANCLGGMCDDETFKKVFADEQKGVDHLNDIQDKLDVWIKDGGVAAMLKGGK